MGLVIAATKIISSVAFFFFLCYMIYVISCYCNWFKAKDDGYILLDFNMFSSLYCHNPNKFYAKEEEIIYISNQCIEKIIPSFGGGQIVKENKRYKVAFKTIFDYIKYRRWRKTEIRNEKNRTINNNTKNAINEIMGERNEQ